MLFTVFELSSLVVRWSNVLLVVSGFRRRWRCRKFIVARVNELGVEQFERDYMKHSFDTLVHIALSCFYTLKLILSCLKYYVGFCCLLFITRWRAQLRAVDVDAGYVHCCSIQCYQESQQEDMMRTRPWSVIVLDSCRRFSCGKIIRMSDEKMGIEFSKFHRAKTGKKTSSDHQSRSWIQICGSSVEMEVWASSRNNFCINICGFPRWIWAELSKTLALGRATTLSFPSARINFLLLNWELDGSKKKVEPQRRRFLAIEKCENWR